MVSPELLRRFPFFGVLPEEPLREVAQASDRVMVDAGEVLSETGQPADYLYLLLEGSVEQYLAVVDSLDPSTRKEFYLGDVNIGELFGLTALLPPYRHTTTARVTAGGAVVKVDAVKFRDVIAGNPAFGRAVMEQTALALLERLEQTRVQLAATRE